MNGSGPDMEQSAELHEDKISIVVPTYNRASDLKDLLFSILKQTRLPMEVIITDDSENFRTRDLIAQVRKYFSNKGVTLKYLHYLRRSSSSAARNRGMTYATGQIVLFLDDDVVLGKDYIKEILKIYKNNPKAFGVQGYVINTPKLENLSLRLRNQLRRIFFLYCLEKDKCRVLPSGANTYTNQIDKVIQCQWLQGCNQSFRFEVIRNEKFDENLKRYSFLEDVDFSYRLFKKYPNSLYMTPYAKVFHKWSKAERLSVKLYVYTQTVNRTYFFYKHFGQSLQNKLIFIWSSIGRMVFPSLLIVTQMLLLKKFPRSKIRYLCFLIKSHIYTLKHLKEIRIGNLEFFDNMF
jgi:GT2 family glycosyltransferase